MKTPFQSLIAAVACAAFALTATAGNYTLHEWGTFTTVIGSDGTHLDGVHLEDAPLPDFVYELDAGMEIDAEASRYTKGRVYRPRLFAGVNVRLETPVLYFYTDEAFDAQVDVGFAGGSIGQWYPNRSAGEPKNTTLDFTKPHNGAIRWNVRVEPPGEDRAARVFHPGELPNWIYPRYPDSALVTNAQGETDSYLFYRGLGRMELPVQFTATDGELQAKNVGEDPIGGWLVFDHNPKGGVRWWKPDPISPGAQATVGLSSQLYLKDWRKRLYAEGIEMLTAAGLNRDEADAMMQTWWASYFEAPGLRVFWIVPRAKVDEVLPLEVTPAPVDVERVIVGRSEILLPSFEQQLVADFADGNKRWRNDRFFPAYSARVTQLNVAAATRDFTAGNLPAGKWQVTFANGVVQTCEIEADGSVSAAQKGRSATGRATMNKDTVLEIRYDDERAERWSLKDNTVAVQHWHPTSAMPDGDSVAGTAVRTRGPKPVVTWDDQISSARVGANVRVHAYEHANFGGACIVLNGVAVAEGTTGNYPLFLNAHDGLKSPDNWNDRITSLVVVDGRTGEKAKAEGPEESLEVVFFQNSRFGAARLKLKAGTQIPDLAAKRIHASATVTQR